MKKLFGCFKKISIILILLLVLVLSSCKGCKKQEIKSIDVPFEDLKLNVGESISALVNVEPKELSDVSLNWSFNNDLVVYENGKLKAVSAGISKCIVTYGDSGVSDTFRIIVSDPINNEYPLIINNYSPDSSDLCYLSYTYYSDTGLYVLPQPEYVIGYDFLGWQVDEEFVSSITPYTTGPVTINGVWSSDTTKISIDNINHDLCIGETVSLNPRSNTQSKDFTYNISNPDVISVDELGNVTALQEGSSKLTIISKVDESITLSTNITVKKIPDEISLNNPTDSIFVGKSAKLRVNSLPSGSSRECNYYVSDSSILSIDSTGTIRGLKEGQVTIKVTSSHNQNLTVEHIINVVQPATEVVVSGLDKDEYLIGDVVNLSASVYPSSVIQDVIYEVSDQSLASITLDGVLTILSKGELSVRVRSALTKEVVWKKTINCLHPLLEEDSSDVKYIISCPGEDASTTICINYHAMNTKTSIELTTYDDSSFSNFKTYIPDGRYFEEMDEKYESPFPARNIFYKEINDLTPGTKYIFRINCGDGTYSDVYNFMTAAGKGNDFSFLWLTDNHYHDVASMEPVFLYAEDVIKSAINLRPDLAFVFDTGDMIDRGGSYNQWDLMYSNRETLKLLPLVSTPGNHELYMNSTGQTDIRFHTAYNAQPKNGPVGKIGTSCYFIFNDVMFIMYDSAATNNYDDQIKWLDDILRTTRENNSAKMIVIGTHKPVHSENPSYAIQDRDDNVMALCDKYSVDLVLTGHYHSQLITPDYFCGTHSSNPLLGTNYLIGNSSRKEGVDGNGYIVDVVDGSKMIVSLIDHLGNILDKWEFETKKEEPFSDEALNTTKDEIVNSLTYRLDSVNNKVIFNISKLSYGTLFKIKVYEKYRGVDSTEYYIINEAYTSFEIDNLYRYYDGLYHIEFYFNDGTILYKDIIVKNNSTLNHTMLDIRGSSAVIGLDPADKSLNLTIKKYDVYVNGKYYTSIDYLDGNDVVEIFKLDNLELNTTYTISFYAVISNGDIMFNNDVTFTTRNK